MDHAAMAIQGLKLASQMRSARALVQARQQASQQGLDQGAAFTPFGDSARPTIDYVKAGDVIRVYVAINPGFYFGGANEAAKFKQLAAQAFNIVRAPADASGFFSGGAWVVDVQPRSDYAKLNDVVNTVLGYAQQSGLSVNAGTSYGQFVSKVENTGTTPATTLPQPGASIETNTSDPFGSFVSSLTSSPVTLAVIIGGAVLLLAAMKK